MVGSLEAGTEAICGADARDLDRTTTETLDWLSRWRNYLVHDDARARAGLAEIAQPGAEVQQLTATMAAEVIRRTDAAFADIGAIVGSRTLAALHSAHLWTALDEA